MIALSTTVADEDVVGQVTAMYCPPLFSATVQRNALPSPPCNNDVLLDQRPALLFSRRLKPMLPVAVARSI